MKFRLVEDFDDLLMENKPAIEPGSELEKNLIYELENTNKSYVQIAKEYGILDDVIANFAHRKNLRDKSGGVKKHHVYFNTIEAAHIDDIDIRRVVAKLRFHPSVYVGEYSIRDIDRIYDYIKNKYFNGLVNTTTLIEFYLKIASGDLSLKALIDEMKKDDLDTITHRSQTFDRKFLTISTDKLPTVDFNLGTYFQLAQDVLTRLGRKSSNSTAFESRYKDLIAAAAKLDPETFDYDTHMNTYISNNLATIAHNIYSETGDIIKETTNYININEDKIPYETSFDVSSPQDIASRLNRYKGYLLYGFMNNTADVIYIGISIYAEKRGSFYSDENRPLILRAFEDGEIKKLIIFKSNLPIQSRTVNTKLIYALEVYFAEQLFKTYPENYPKALNKQKPGQNTSRLIASQNRNNFERFINNQERMLSYAEFISAGKEKLKVTENQLTRLYPYYKYAENYIDKHDGDLSIEDKEVLYRSLSRPHKYIFWAICSSESEFKKITQIHHVGSNEKRKIDDWKNYRIKNNLPITEDLDDDIDMEYYV